MAEAPKEPPRRGRPRVDHPRTVTLSIRLRIVEYDALCRRAYQADDNVAEMGRKAIRRMLSE